MPYSSKQAVADALKPGSKVVGEAPYTVKVTNPQAGLPGQPAQIDQPAGVTLSILGADGQPDTIVVKEVGNADTKGGAGFDVIQGPQVKPTAKATPAAGLERLDANLQPLTDPNKPAVYVRDPNAPAGTQPFKVDPTITTDPATWTPIKDPNDKSANPRIIGLWDPANNKIGASVTAPTGSKDSDPSTWKPIYRTPGDTGSGIVGQWDPVNNELHAVSAGPDNTQVVQTATGIYSVDKTKGTSTLIQKLDPADPNKQAVSVGSKVYSFDPKDGSFTLPTNVQEAATVGNSTTLKELIWYDSQGNEVNRRPNPNYQAPPAAVPAVDKNARLIPIADPDKPGQLKWVENQGRVVASDALKQLASSLTGQVVGGDMSQDEAIALINAANSRMTNDINAQQGVTTAASDVLANTRGNAQTGAGLLQQRVQAATGTLQSILGNALSNKNITSIPGDVGANLVQGLQGWTADLMGGQGTLDSASRLVQMADPKSDLADPTTQAAIGTLRQMLDKHAELTGGLHPADAAARAAGASVQNGGMVAPGGYNPADIQWNQPPQNAPGRVMGPGGVITGGVPATQAVQAVAPVAPVAQVPGQNYGANIAYTNGWIPGTGTTPQPLPASYFIAPGAPVQLARSN